MDDKKCPNYAGGGKCMSDEANDSKSCSETYVEDYENCPYQDNDGK